VITLSQYSSDSGWEQVTGPQGVVWNYFDGVQYFSRFGYVPVYGWNYGGWRFLMTGIKRYAFISSATLRLTRYIARGFVTNGSLYAIKEENVNISTAWANRWVARTLTTASVVWQFPTGNAQQQSTSSDIKTVVQEIVNQSTWSPGNAIGLLYYGTETPSDSTQYVYGQGEATVARKPLLTVTYKNPGPFASGMPSIT